MAIHPTRQSRRTLIPQTDPIQPQYWDAAQIAAYYNISPDTARRKARLDLWPGAVCLGGVWRFPIPADAATKSAPVPVPLVEEQNT